MESFLLFPERSAPSVKTTAGRVPDSQCQGTRVGLGELAGVQSRRGADNESLLSLLLSPSVNSLQKPPAAEASCKPSLFILKHPQSQMFQNQLFLL